MGEGLLDGEARQRAALLTAALDHVAEGVALVDGSGRLVWRNQAAAAVFQAGDGLAEGPDRRLIVRSIAARGDLKRALEGCRAPGAAATVLQVAVPRPGRRPVILTLRPLPADVAQSVGPGVLLFLADPEATRRGPGPAFRSVYRLSPAEARLVEGLSEGLSLRQVARRDALTYETVRSYVKRVLHKTGARRQAELLRLTGIMG